MREICTLYLCDATASQAGSMRGIRRKMAKFVLRVAEGRAGVPDEGRPALLYTPWKPHGNHSILEKEEDVICEKSLNFCLDCF